MFVSYTFILFLAILFLLYYLIPKSGQWRLLLAASLLFYGAADVRYLIFIGITSLTVYAAAQGLEMCQSGRKAIMFFCLLINIGILAVVKYTNFALQNINYIRERMGGNPLGLVDLIVPMGISFYTFQAVGYLVDVYRGKYKAEKNYFRFLLFVSFFPQLVQGPISRYDHLSETLYRKHDFEGRQVLSGLERILWGYFKKLVIADRIGVAVAALSGSPRYYTGVYVLVNMLFYAVQIYADFAGGIDITIGIAEVFGIRVRENFIRPYFSKSVAEYWRRWHISMGTWFKDYVFFSLAASRPLRKVNQFCKKHFGRAVARRSVLYISTIVVWLSTGIWHGAEWRFVVWGLLNGIILLTSDELVPLYRRFHKRFSKLSATAFYRGVQVARTFFLTSALNLFDVYGSVRRTFRQFAHMFTQWGSRTLTGEELLELGLTPGDYFVLVLGVVLLFAVSMRGRRGSVREGLNEKSYALRYAVVAGMFFCVVLFGTYGQGYDVQQFIYNQF